MNKAENRRQRLGRKTEMEVEQFENGRDEKGPRQ